jgi:hypothetical protein
MAGPRSSLHGRCRASDTVAKMMIRNEDIKELRVEIPEGHLHIRTTLVLQDDTTITLQEAAAANLVRAFITVKTHPTRHQCD